MKQRKQKSVLDSHAFINIEEDMKEEQFKEYMKLYKERTEALLDIADRLNSMSDIGHEVGKLQANVGYLVDTVHRIGNIMDK